MFQRFHAMREEREGGFTLIELLVVILIIAILAAIAIPVFLNQRRKGWISQAQSALKNMATAEESWLTSNPSYTLNVADLESEGFTYSAEDVDPSVVSADSTTYCLRAESMHDDTIVWYYDSDVGRPQEAAC
jgi:type IV pilus assembly protein PilA